MAKIVGRWPMAKIFKDDNRDVRSLHLKVGQCKSNEVCTILEEPLTKILPLLERENVQFPNEEHQ